MLLACSSYVQSKFLCGEKGPKYLMNYIPSSRVNDGELNVICYWIEFHWLILGVCDCCDGSDEKSRKCPDLCTSQITEYRKLALQQYRTVQGGVQVMWVMFKERGVVWFAALVL